MINDFKITLTSRPILAILSFSILLRLFLSLFVLTDKPSIFGPDELTYSSLAKFVSRGLPVNYFPTFGEGLYHSSKALILPSALLIRLGFDDLLAVRTISSMYGIASCIVLTLSFSAFHRLQYPNIKISSSIFKSKFLFLLALFSFLPSNFLWSNIGLRESSSQFWALMIFYLLLSLVKQKRSHQLISSFSLVCAIIFMFSSRPQTAYVFCFTIAVVLAILFLKTRKSFAGISLALVLLGSLLGQYTTVSSTFTVTGPNTQVRNSADTSLERNILEETLSRLTYQRHVNTLGAGSALKPPKCLEIMDNLSALTTCNLSELPYRLFAFLFRPLLFYDTGSRFLNYAQFENILWSILLISSLRVVFRRSQSSLTRLINIGLILYVTVFASSAALYEGNLGTAFRHKSALLWSIVFILMMAQARESHLNGKGSAT